MYNRLDSIPACDGRTDRQTDGHLAMHMRRAVKIARSYKHLSSRCTMACDTSKKIR